MGSSADEGKPKAPIDPITFSHKQMVELLGRSLGEQYRHLLAEAPPERMKQLIIRLTQEGNPPEMPDDGGAK